MSWIVATLFSAFFLGCYDLCIKNSVRDNAVLPVLFFANLCSATVWGLLFFVGRHAPAALPAALQVTPLTGMQHLLMLAKSAIVAASWVCSYFAMKHLPLSLASPIRATGPMWTLFGAILFLAERPSWLEGLGIAITLASFIALSFAEVSSHIPIAGSVYQRMASGYGAGSLEASTISSTKCVRPTPS